jgi:hypothetical protein
MRNVTVGHVADAILTIDFNYEEGETGHHYPLVQNINLEKVTAKSAPRVLALAGYAKSPIRNVKLLDCSFGGVERDDEIEFVEGLEKTNVRIDRQ